MAKPVGETASQRVNWNGVLKQSGLFLGIQHGFRLATEKGTREMKGAFFPRFAQAVGNLHGWGDGDPFLVNYVGHPMQGSVSAYIWANNDGRYRGVEFGRDPRYWKSRLRATAWSFAYSSQFEIGPVSEASIGYIQASYPQQGFVDHVVTPVIGMGWMIAEDAIDKYLIEPFEARVNNFWARILVRGWLNPTRSMANMMAFRAPWVRDTRAGARSYDRTAALNLRSRRTAPASEDAVAEVAPFEFTAVSKIQRYSGLGLSQSCAGGGGEGAVRVAEHWQFVVDVSGCRLLGLDAITSGDSLSFVAGPRWTPSPAGRFSPYFQVLLGGNKLTQDRENPEKRRLLEEKGKLGLKPSDRNEYVDHVESTAFLFTTAAGVDVKLSRGLALRLAQVGYQHSWTSRLNGFSYGDGLQLSTGVILRMGTW